MGYRGTLCILFATFHKFQTILKLKVYFRVGRRKLGGRLTRERVYVYL